VACGAALDSITHGTALSDEPSPGCSFRWCQDGASFAATKRSRSSVADEGGFLFQALVLRELEDVVFQVRYPLSDLSAQNCFFFVCNGETCTVPD
jgi:hypothetical protein